MWSIKTNIKHKLYSIETNYLFYPPLPHSLAPLSLPFVVHKGVLRQPARHQSHAYARDVTFFQPDPLSNEPKDVITSKCMVLQNPKFIAMFMKGCSIYPRHISPRSNCIYCRSGNSLLLFSDHIFYAFLIPLLQYPHHIFLYIALKKYIHNTFWIRGKEATCARA